MSVIYYLGYYDTPENGAECRQYTLAAANKMNYIISVLEKLGYTVEVISPCVTQGKRFYKGKTVSVGQNSRLRLFATAPYRPRPIRILGRLMTRWQMLRYIRRQVKPGDTVLAYHSLALIKHLQYLKKKCGFRLLLEVEELYGDVMEDRSVTQRELEFCQLAEGYLFPAKRLADTVNRSGKPYAMIHGTYQAEEFETCQFTKKEWAGKIHCVYAGTFDPRKGGALMAIEAAQYLPENYYVHILGFGDEAQLAQVKEKIRQVSEKNVCGLSYDGCLKGDKYLKFLQRCQIGLSTQKPEGTYNDTSFPSKILTYMANGLKVVTVRIPVIEESAVDTYMYYYDRSDPRDIAAAVMAAADAQSRDGRSALRQLDLEFTQSMKALLEDV